jgi:hypothetical protein
MDQVGRGVLIYMAIYLAQAALAGERSEPVRLGVRDHHACSV